MSRSTNKRKFLAILTSFLVVFNSFSPFISVISKEAYASEDLSANEVFESSEASPSASSDSTPPLEVTETSPLTETPEHQSIRETMDPPTLDWSG